MFSAANTTVSTLNSITFTLHSIKMYHPLWKFNIVYLSLMMLGYSQAQETQDHFVGTQLIVSKHHGCLVDGRNGLEFRSCPSRGKSDSDAYWRFIPELIDTNGATYYAIYKATGDECISSVNSKLITAPCHRDDHHLWRIAKRDK
jgi:hypothetical protein